MDSLVKQRLVGALILVALAVVFWPIIFMPASDVDRDELRVQVPAAPPVDLRPLPEPDSAGLRQGPEAQARGESVDDVLFPADGNEPLEPAALPRRAESVPEPELAEARESLEAPALDADGLPIAFSLQVATMADRERAEALRDELVNAGYKGYLKRVRRDDRVLYRVLVGPKYSRDELLPVKDVIDQTWRVESMIIRYLP